jgi:hypothetical protein
VTPLATWRVTIAIAGIVVFMWGAKTQSEAARWVGIACLVVALVLRFLGPRRPR